MGWSAAEPHGQCSGSFRPASRQTRDRPREIVDAKAPGSLSAGRHGATLGVGCGSPSGGPQRAAQEVWAIQPASLAPWLDGINRAGRRDRSARPPGRLSERRLRGGQGAGLGLGCGRAWRRPWGVVCPPSWRVAPCGALRRVACGRRHCRRLTSGHHMRSFAAALPFGFELATYAAPATGRARAWSLDREFMADAGCLGRLTVLGRCFELWRPSGA